MIINSLNLVFEADDLQRLLAKMTGDVEKLKELSVALEEGCVVISGKISVGLSIPFSTKWQARIIDEGAAAGLSLSGISLGMAGMEEEMISSQVLSLLESKLQDYDAVRVEGREIVVDLPPALAARGITLNTPLKKLNIAPSGITLEA